MASTWNRIACGTKLSGPNISERACAEPAVPRSVEAESRGHCSSVNECGIVVQIPVGIRIAKKHQMPTYRKAVDTCTVLTTESTIKVKFKGNKRYGNSRNRKEQKMETSEGV
jgi:hypothetical protein